MADKKVSESAGTAAQVADKPSESEEQVATSESTEETVVKPSEVAPAEQEPKVEDQLAKLTDEELEKLPDDHPLKRYVQSEADKHTAKALETARAQQQERERLVQTQQQREAARVARDQNLGIFRELQRLQQQDPPQWQRYMNDPQYAAVWQQGLNAKPGVDELDAAYRDGEDSGTRKLYGTVYQGLLSEIGTLSAEEADRLDGNKFKGVSNPHAAYIAEMCNILVDRQLEPKVAKAVKAKEDAIRADERKKVKEEFRAAGIGPEEIEGSGPSALPSLEDIGKMSVEQVQQLERDGRLDRVLAKHK